MLNRTPPKKVKALATDYSPRLFHCNYWHHCILRCPYLWLMFSQKFKCHFVDALIFLVQRSCTNRSVLEPRTTLLDLMNCEFCENSGMPPAPGTCCLGGACSLILGSSCKTTLTTITDGVHKSDELRTFELSSLPEFSKD